MSRIYVASSWRNTEQPHIVKQLREVGHAVYDFRNPFSGVPGFAWSEIDPNWQAWSARRYRDLLTTHPIAARSFVSDLRGMQWADACLLVLPSGRSAHLEAGWFCGQGKRTIILTRDGEEPELMALLATDICVDMDEVLRVLATMTSLTTLAHDLVANWPATQDEQEAAALKALEVAAVRMRDRAVVTARHLIFADEIAEAISALPLSSDEKEKGQ